MIDREAERFSAEIADNPDFADKILTLIFRNEPRGQEFRELSQRIAVTLETADDEIVNTFMTRRLDAEFGQKLGNVNHPRRKALVSLNIKNNRIEFYSSGSRHNLVLTNYFSLNKTLIYIDDPFMIDELNNYDSTRPLDCGHRSRMLEILCRRQNSKKRTVTEEIITNNKLKQVFSELNAISDGELVVDSYNKFSYRHSGLKEALSLSSVSTGIKTFMILKELLLNGSLEENGIVVVDEPEVHLHPEWQINFAKIIVLLQKAYRLNIVLTTHSMDFLSAIDHSSQRFGTADLCNYYLTGLEPDEEFPCAVIHEMNSDKEALYESVSAPYLSLYEQMN